MEVGRTESGYYKGEAARDEYRALSAPAPASAAKQEAPASAPAMSLEVMGSEAAAEYKVLARIERQLLKVLKVFHLK